MALDADEKKTFIGYYFSSTIYTYFQVVCSMYKVACIKASVVVPSYMYQTSFAMELEVLFEPFLLKF